MYPSNSISGTNMSLKLNYIFKKMNRQKLAQDLSKSLSISYFKMQI